MAAWTRLLAVGIEKRGHCERGAAASSGFSRAACGGRGREPAGCVPGSLVLKPEGRCSHVVTRWRWGEGRVEGGQRVESVRPVGGRTLWTL